jgi:creatinine amidohydrolase
MLADLSSERLRAIAPGALVVIPVGAVEQHGPHLPVGHDSYNVQQIAEMAVMRTGDRAILVTPTISYGASQHHLGFCGTMSLRSSTFLALLCDLGVSLAAGGFRKLFFLNGHGGNRHILRAAVMDLVHDHGCDLIVGTSEYWEIAKAQLSAIGEKNPGHAGTFETALQMARDAESVDPVVLAGLQAGQASDDPGCPFRPVTRTERELLRFATLRPRALCQRPDMYLRSGGISEIPGDASQQLGERLLATIVAAVADFLIEFKQHP